MGGQKVTRRQKDISKLLREKKLPLRHLLKKDDKNLLSKKYSQK
jgi:hypothetical protein